MMGPGIVVGSHGCCGGQSPATAAEAPHVTQSPHWHWQGKGAALQWQL
jgi:hypothetical protein